MFASQETNEISSFSPFGFNIRVKKRTHMLTESGFVAPVSFCLHNTYYVINRIFIVTCNSPLDINVNT